MFGQPDGVAIEQMRGVYNTLAFISRTMALMPEAH